MRKKRIWAGLLAACLSLVLLPAQAAETANEWLIPKARDYPAFTDTRGTIAEEAAKICCQVGLMDGVNQRHFMPSIGLSKAQVIVIAARLHKLLTGGSLEYFAPISLKGPDWWTPYDNYLKENLDGWPLDLNARSAESPGDLQAYSISQCSRGFFLTLLSAVLEDAKVELPMINTVPAVPDCNDPKILQLYRWGILSGKDEYGMLYASASLSRSAAAAMLARIVDPSQRLRFTLKTFDLCEDVFLWERETVVLTIDGTDITAEQFAPALANDLAHNQGMWRDITFAEHLQYAINSMKRDIAIDRLASKSSVVWSPEDLVFGGVYGDGYKGQSANGQLWNASHNYLYAALQAFYKETCGEPEPGDSDSYKKLNADIAALMESFAVTQTPALEALDMSAADNRLLTYPTYRFQDQGTN